MRNSKSVLTLLNDRVFFSSRISRLRPIAALLISLIGVLSLRSFTAEAAQGAHSKETILVANTDDVLAFPANAHGNVRPLALTTDMASPSALARDTSGRLYVTNSATSTVTIYPASSSGNVAPLAVIGGSNTGLTSPSGIALDPTGNIYVLNSGQDRILVYSALGTNTGVLNEAPIRIIAGSKTRLRSPAAITLDAAGNIYVANQAGSGKLGRYCILGAITIYPAGSSGDVAPMGMIHGSATGLVSPVSIVLDLHGNIYVGNSGCYSRNPVKTRPVNIEVFDAGSMGNVAPVGTIAGANTLLSYPQALAVDSSSNIYVNYYSNGLSGVAMYPAGSSGNVSPASTLIGNASNLASPVGITLDGAGTVYVANEMGGPNHSGSVTIYPAGSSGDIAPIATITSAFTGMQSVQSVAADSLGNIYVANLLGGTGNNGGITIYSATSYATDAPLATITGPDTALYGPSAVALTPKGSLAVMNRGGGSIAEFPAGSSGDAVPNVTINLDPNEFANGMTVDSDNDFVVVNGPVEQCNLRRCYVTKQGSIAVYSEGSDGAGKPRTVIAGPLTRLASPSAIAAGKDGRIYVTNEGPITCPIRNCSCLTSGHGNVTIYDAAEKGDAAPIGTIGGPRTGLDYPYGVTLDSSGNIYVLNADGLDGVFICYIRGAGRSAVPLSSGRRIAGGMTDLSSSQFSYPDYTLADPILVFAPGAKGDVPPIRTIGGPQTSMWGPAGLTIAPW